MSIAFRFEGGGKAMIFPLLIFRNPSFDFIQRIHLAVMVADGLLRIAQQVSFWNVGKEKPAARALTC